MLSIIRGAMAVAVVLYLGTAPQARAQFHPLMRPSPFRPMIPLGGFTSPWGSYSFGQSQILSFTKVLPTGQVMTFNYGYQQAGLPLLNHYFVNPVYAGGLSGGTYGGFNTLTYGSANPTLARMQQELGLAQMQANNIAAATSSRGDSYDKWLAERATTEAKTDPLKAVDVALINPVEEEILSGKVLNELAARVADLEKKGKRSASPLFPPELLGKITYAGGAAADAANSIRTSTPAYPEVLRQRLFANVCSDLTDAYTPVAAAVLAGKKVDPAQADKLASVSKKSRDAVAPDLVNASIADTAAVARFFNQLDSAARYLKEPASVGVVVPRWSSVGSNVTELVQHLGRFQLRFDRVLPGDEAAYYSLHRGLLAHYASLTQAKK